MNELQTIEKKVEALLPHLNLSNLVYDAIPHTVANDLFVAGTHLVAVAETTLPIVQPLLGSSHPFVLLLEAYVSNLTPGITPPSGTTMLKGFVTCIPQMQAFIKSVPINSNASVAVQAIIKLIAAHEASPHTAPTD